MERSLGVQLGVGEEIHESSLLHKLVFFINSGILKLLLCMSQVSVLLHLYGISPHVGELNVLVLRVYIVEY